MKPGLTHRLRMHKLREEDRHVTYAGWWEGGRIDRVLQCSCGRSWVCIPDPVTWQDRWR